MEIDGDYPTILTEFSVALTEIRKKDEEILPVILAAVYTKGGSESLKDTLEGFKKDTSKALKMIEESEKRRWKI